MKNNTTAHINDCYGCGVCVAACPHKALGLRYDQRGFYSPYMQDEKACTKCGMCLNVCSYADEQLSEENKVLDWSAMWSKNPEVRKTCSSGGVAYEIALQALEKGYEVVGVRYNTKEHRAEHVICTTQDELKSTKGSKYIQSYTVDAFRQFRRNKRYLVVGTPCQIDSLKRWVVKRKMSDNFTFMDFFCHGVPSYWVWKKYVKENFGANELSDMAFRCKTNIETGEDISWHNSFMVTGYKGDSGIQPGLHSSEDWFYHYFLDDLCLGKACYEHCKFKLYKSAADIRIGDAWGKTYAQDNKGVSAVLAFTEQGKVLLKQCANRVIKEDVPLDKLCEGQMKMSPPLPLLYDMRLWLMRSTSITLHNIHRIMKKMQRLRKRIGLKG